MEPSCCLSGFMVGRMKSSFRLDEKGMVLSMIQVENNVILLQTKNTSYVIYADETGNLIHLYYGAKIVASGDMLKAMLPRTGNQNGCSIIADLKSPNLCLDDVCLELSSRGKGDMREPFVELTYADGSTTSDFRFEEVRLLVDKVSPSNLPSAYLEKKEEKTEDGVRNVTYQSAVISLRDKNSDVRLELVYSVFEECDCITRFARLINEGNDTIGINRLMSAQLDLDKTQLKLTSFHGDWAREMNRYDVLLQAGKFENDSTTGFSSNKANPFMMYGDIAVTEQAGECYATNLLYSGNHKEVVEAGGHGKMRIMTGVNPDFFSWKLQSGECFESPEAVLTYSNQGYEGISTHMHAFVREHIVRGTWQKKERPILLNSWEATYFGVQEKKVLKLAKAASEAGIELFVLDDGWFGKRNNDSTSLGDWYDNKKKLPNGLAGVSARIKAMGMKFGIWVEPEMVSEDSDLYRAHPDWAVKIPGKAHALGRNQMILDLTRTHVQDYIIENMSDVFTRSKADYVKWDMNRHMSDYYSQGLSAEGQGEFSFRYMLGLYHVLDVLTTRFPDILFEACASGGNRFDLGMLCYMPQIWASDCTDAMCRGIIQNGYSYGYPQSVIGAHVSGCPNHQTLRVTPLETRFAIASAGILGYECNLCDAKADEIAEIKEQISLYKRWRKTLQFGQFYRLNSGVECAYGMLSPMNQNAPFDTDLIRWNIVAPDQSEAIGIMMQTYALPNYGHHTFRAKGLEDESLYHFYNRKLKYNIHRMGDLINTAIPVHIRQDSMVHDVVAKFYKLDGEIEDVTVSGSILNQFGVKLSQSYGGTGLAANTALYQDYDARMYFMEKV